MGFFDFIAGVGQKIGTGISDLGKKVESGVQIAGKVIKDMGKEETWIEGTKLAGKWLQAPQKYIQEHDPIAQKMGNYGALSPLSLGASIFTVMPSSAGYLLNFADKKQRDKLESGDAETIANTAFSGIGVIPMPGGGLAGSAIRGGAKGTRALGKAVAKSSLGML